MKVDVVMPKLGESIMEGTVLKWWKEIGDTVEKDETLLEISTDKVDSEIPSPYEGTLVEILVNEQDTVEVGTVVARLETEAGADVTPPEKAGGPAQEKEAQEETVVKPPSMDTKVMEKLNTRTMKRPPVEKGDRSTFYSPLVLNIAGKEGISMDELASINGSGKGGRVTKRDILNYVENRGAAPSKAPSFTPAQPVSTGSMEVEVIPMDNVRKKIAHHMRMSLDTSAHVYSVSECDVTNIQQIVKKHRPRFMEEEGMKLTFNPFILYAVTKAVQDFPIINSSVDGDNIVRKKKVNLGMAVATDHGLFVPVIKSASDLNFRGLARQSYSLAIKARDKKLALSDIEGSTISVTNPGVFGNIFGLPIINQPNSAILGVGAIKKRPVVIEDEVYGDTIAIRSMVYLSLSYDHRIIDGEVGGQYLQRVCEILENVTEDVL